MREWDAAGMDPCSQAIRNYFGSWNNFLRAAGLDTEKKEKHRFALEAVKEAARLLGHCPTLSLPTAKAGGV